jgi:hypothetical protein
MQQWRISTWYSMDAGTCFDLYSSGFCGSYGPVVPML